MKKMIQKLQLLCTILLIAQGLRGQCFEFDRLIALGDQQAQEHDFAGALDAYQTATVDCIERLPIVNARIYKMVEVALPLIQENASTIASIMEQARIALLYTKMIDSMITCIDSTGHVLAAVSKKLDVVQAKKDYVEMRFQALLDSMMHLGRAYTLATGLDEKGRLRYYYVDRHGEKVEKLGTWRMATQFQADGLATVQKKKKSALLDTTGTTFSITLAHSQYHDRAADHSAENLRHLPEITYDMTLLQILVADENRIRKIPPRIKHCHRLRYLNLAANNLKDMDAIVKNYALRELNLSHNHIEEFPRKICKLRGLTEIDLSYNNLKEIHDSLGRLRVLRTLNLEYNEIHRLGYEVSGWRQLRKLELSFNHLKDLPPWITQLKNLEWLGLTGNEILNGKDGCFLSHLRALPKLRVLRIGHNPCSNTPEKRASLKAAIKAQLPRCVVVFN